MVYQDKILYATDENTGQIVAYYLAASELQWIIEHSSFNQHERVSSHDDILHEIYKEDLAKVLDHGTEVASLAYGDPLSKEDQFEKLNDKFKIETTLNALVYRLGQYAYIFGDLAEEKHTQTHEENNVALNDEASLGRNLFSENNTATLVQEA